VFFGTFLRTWDRYSWVLLRGKDFLTSRKEKEKGTRREYFISHLRPTVRRQIKAPTAPDYSLQYCNVPVTYVRRVQVGRRSSENFIHGSTLVLKRIDPYEMYICLSS
jgi:hypothetical protein